VAALLSTAVAPVLNVFLILLTVDAAIPGLSGRV